MNEPISDDILFARVCDGLATPEETAQLHRRLRSEEHTSELQSH